ncbi:hypothetical protein BOTBODRAFT_236799 [Botryobasidium botryosum FD-172 SS1]|uniref:SCP domain-containing protein n=1 Tax=Botryobasidium botryosum (strain FD-172 SS1) TaxID=930990 RepID=A0A067MYM2_BOTB1|nr:hypothetical protein BOTBODRAFT_236799 [Botryobasidium botryosum FD-172 SS1]
MRFQAILLYAFAVASAAVAAPTQEQEQGAFAASPNDYLGPHNTFRAKHGAKPLTWSNSLAASAQAWANRCQFQHSGTQGVGENLAAGTGNFTPAGAIKAWTDEASQYNPTNPVPSHFTQVVWKSTTQVGCAVASCSGIFDPKYGKANYYVCQYSPPGNVIGQFSANVQL